MEDLQRFIAEHIDLLIIFALVILPVIFGRKKKRQPRAPMSPSNQAEAADKERSQTLEDKVRKFFEGMVEEASSPRPVARTPLPKPEEPVSAPTMPRPKPAPSRPARPKIFDPLIEEGSAAAKPRDARPMTSRRTLPPDSSEDPWATDIRLSSPEDLEALPEELPPREAKRLMKKLDDAYGGWETDRPAHGASLDHFSVKSLYRLSRADLKKAIVLKEILDPPVGFRT